MPNSKLYDHAKELLEESNSFLITTIDRNGFPSTIVVSPPVLREGISLFQFYIDGEGSTANNILKNAHGCICCYKEQEYRSLAIKGKFKLVEIEDMETLSPRLSDHAKELNYDYPVLAEFTSVTVKAHGDLKSRTVNVSEL